MIHEEANACMVQMQGALMLQLRGNVQLPTCLRVMGYLRRLALCSDHQMRILFLHVRDAWLLKVYDYYMTSWWPLKLRRLTGNNLMIDRFIDLSNNVFYVLYLGDWRHPGNWCACIHQQIHWSQQSACFRNCYSIQGQCFLPVWWHPFNWLTNIGHLLLFSRRCKLRPEHMFTQQLGAN